MRDTESPDCPNLSWEINPGKLLVIAFAGMATGLNELANFEFVKTTNQLDCSKIFCRDAIRAFYHRGISDDLVCIPDIVVRLQELIEKASPSAVVCVGVSAGGYAALIFAHLLKANTAHAFGPQTMLHKQWGLDYSDNTIYACSGLLYDRSDLPDVQLSPENDFRDLSKVLADYNGKTKYNIYVGKDCEQDLHHARAIENQPGVKILLYPGSTHACVSQNLGRQALGQLIITL